MSNAICALVIVGSYDRDIAGKIDLRALTTYEEVTVLPIDHFYATFWAAEANVGGELDVPRHVPPTFPRETVLLQFVRDLTGKRDPKFAIIQTDDSNGRNVQWAAAFAGARRVSGDSASINEALKLIGVTRRYPKDEFETIGLGAIGNNPRHLEKYQSWCIEHDGVVRAMAEDGTDRVSLY